MKRKDRPLMVEEKVYSEAQVRSMLNDTGNMFEETELKLRALADYAGVSLRRSRDFLSGAATMSQVAALIVRDRIDESGTIESNDFYIEQMAESLMTWMEGQRKTIRALLAAIPKSDEPSLAAIVGQDDDA